MAIQARCMQCRHFWQNLWHQAQEKNTPAASGPHWAFHKSLIRASVCAGLRRAVSADLTPLPTDAMQCVIVLPTLHYLVPDPGNNAIIFCDPPGSLETAGNPCSKSKPGTYLLHSTPAWDTFILILEWCHEVLFGRSRAYSAYII